MSQDNFNQNDRNLEAQRRKRAENFRLNIQDDFDDFGDDSGFSEPSDLNSYSGEEVREKIARDSKNALKRKKKEEKKERKAKNKPNRRVFRWLWVVSVVIVGVMLSLFIITGMNDMLAINRVDSSKVTVNIPENPSLNDVTDELINKGIIDESLYFELYASMTDSADYFNQGTYELRKNMDYQAIISSLQSSGNRQDIVSVTIYEGQNILEVANTLKENKALGDVDKFLELCKSDTFDEDFTFLADIKNKNDRYYKLEGYLYPDKYDFYVNEDPENIIYKFLNNYENKIGEKQDVWNYEKLVTVEKMVEESDTEYTLDEIMTIASIIQAEAANKEDMYYVSSILHNRLEASVDMGVSNLGLDSTRFYPYRNAESVPENLGKDYVSKYDTYDKAGLPAGPICNPGMEAIKAALNPYDTGYYFFCHDSEGKAYYAETLYGQESNLEYIRSYDEQ